MQVNHEAIIEFSALDFLFSIITFLVLFLILKHFFFDKVHDFMEARSKDIQDQLDHAAETNRQADEKMEAYNARIADVERESRDIIKKSRDEAKVQANLIIEEANEEARKSFEHAKAEIEREKQGAQKELRKEVGNLAILAAEKILEKEMDPDTHQELVEKAIKEAGEETWN